MSGHFTSINVMKVTNNGSNSSYCVQYVHRITVFETQEFTVLNLPYVSSHRRCGGLVRARTLFLLRWDSDVPKFYLLGVEGGVE